MKAQPLIVYLPDTKGVEIARHGIGNLKLGLGVYTYSRLPGKAHGTCPGSTDWCEATCYAKHVRGEVADVWARNCELGDDAVPPLPPDAQVVRLHVGGDFDTVPYIFNWIIELKGRPDVTAWAYTRSWRVPELLPMLEELRALPNMQLFASMDPSHTDLPPRGWRRAWVLGPVPEPRLDLTRQVIGMGPSGGFEAHRCGDLMTRCNLDRVPSYVCPEETGRKADCLSCGYCFEGRKNDVTFLEH